MQVLNRTLLITIYDMGFMGYAIKQSSGAGKTHMATALGVEACKTTIGPDLPLATLWLTN